MYMYMNEKFLPVMFCCLTLLFSAAAAHARFLELIPSTDMVSGDGPQKVGLNAVLAPSGGREAFPEMGRPERFVVLHQGRLDVLTATLSPAMIDGRAGYQIGYTIENPGDHVFALAWSPYWEPANEKMISQYAKVVVNGLGRQDGWDEPVRFPVEIDPLVRPYGLWTGNTFQGMVKRGGRPVPFADVEVKFLNRDGRAVIPAGPLAIQRLKTDIHGVFTYTMPRRGWWGFAARVEGDELTEGPDGTRVVAELVGLLWVRCIDMVVNR